MANFDWFKDGGTLNPELKFSQNGGHHVTRAATGLICLFGVVIFYIPLLSLMIYSRL